MPASAKANSKRPRRARGSINPADIVTGAFEFCRTTPVDEMTMPRLAAFLNVGVTSIYWYFKSKRELLDAMTEEALVSFYESMPPLRSQGWEDMLREFFVSFYTLLAADPLKCDLIVRRIGSQDDEGAMRSWDRADQLLTALADAGFPPSLARHAFFTLSIYTQGFLLVQRGAITAAIWAVVTPRLLPSSTTVELFCRTLRIIRVSALSYPPKNICARTVGEKSLLRVSNQSPWWRIHFLVTAPISCPARSLATIFAMRSFTADAVTSCADCRD